MALTAKTGMHARRGPKARRTPRATRALAAPGNDGMSAFVAGSTGRLGFRVVRELTKQGVSVRAGARDTERAWRVFKGEEVPSGVGYTGQKDAPTYGELDVSRVEAVQADIFEAKGGLTSAIGDAKTVVSCLGPPETNVGDPSLPRRVDWEGTGRLIEAAEEAGVEHFVLVTSLGTGRFGWPSALLNLFWQILDWKAKAERRLMESSQMEFTIVRPGGMEKPTDDHKETHWARLCEPDTVFGGTISRLQVAEICAAAVRNRDESTNKIYEAIAEEDAPRIPYEEQLEFVPRLPRGCPDRDGLPDVLNRKYRADQRDRWLPLLMDFSPRGPWPEVLNGRCVRPGLSCALSPLKGLRRGS